MPVQDHPGDPGLGGDVVQARGGEPVTGERLRRRREDLLPALRARQTAAPAPGLPLATTTLSSYIRLSVLTHVFTVEYTNVRKA